MWKVFADNAKTKSQPLYGIIVCFCLFVVGAFLCFMNGIAEIYIIDGKIHVQLYGLGICFYFNIFGEFAEEVPNEQQKIYVS